MDTDSTVSRKRVALVCTNFSMQSAFGLLIIAINSVRLGFETMIYFTFEGLHMVRPGRLAQLRYYPTGVDPSEPEVDRFVMHSERLTRHMLETGPGDADVVIDIDDQHNLVRANQS